MSGTRKQKELTSLSFFSGCLGLDLGLEKAGIHQLLACDFDKHCRNTISANLYLKAKRLSSGSADFFLLSFASSTYSS